MMRKLSIAIGALLANAAFSAPADEVWIEPLTGMQFVAVPKGCFQMGTAKPVPPPADTQWEKIRFTGSISEDEVPQHEVCVERFWMGKFEVRVKEWQLVMDTAALQSEGMNLPVAGVSWTQASEFAERLTARSGGKYKLRLPTEAEWEYACRAGAKADKWPKPEVEDLKKVAWYQYRSPKPYLVGALKANAFGLHDMLGNVWEWTGDSYAADGYARHALFDPRIDKGDGPRVIRGGSFRTELEQTRCGKRGHYAANEGLDTIGLRLVRER